ncbi:bacteriophage antitermination protein Q [Aeromonas sp. R7-1]|uniref:bacteriophage antitermination protein Q n=1 Tax=Aeromonas sp. R7-1 TaxID=3138473 RepID=UPI0034A3FF7A
MREHEIAHWRDALQTAFQVAHGPAVREGQEVGASVPGSRILINQAQLEAGRMLRHIPRLPVQNANWLHFAYQVEYQSSPHRNLAQELFEQLSSRQQLHATTRSTFYQLCLAALIQARLSRQAVSTTPPFTTTDLATLVGLANPGPTSWSRSRWAPRWRDLLAHIDSLDRASIIELVELRQLIRKCQEITHQCASPPISRR